MTLMAKKRITGKAFYKPEDTVQTYLNPRLKKLFSAHAFDLSESRSSTAEAIIKDFFSHKSEKEIERLLKLYDTMTVEQIRNPGKRE